MTKMASPKPTIRQFWSVALILLWFNQANTCTCRKNKKYVNIHTCRAVKVHVKQVKNKKYINIHTSCIKIMQLTNPIFNHWTSVINKSVKIVRFSDLSKPHKRLNIDERMRSLK